MNLQLYRLSWLNIILFMLRTNIITNLLCFFYINFPVYLYIILFLISISLYAATISTFVNVI